MDVLSCGRIGVEGRVRFDRGRFLTIGWVALALGVFAVLASTEEFADGFTEDVPELRELFDSFSPLLLLLAPVFIVAGIVMLIVGFASSKDEPKSAVDDAALDARTRQIMESEGLGWTAAWHRAKNETPQPPPEPAQDSPDLEHRLRELKQLHDDGLIDTDEYQRKQRTLLDGL